MSGEIGNEDIDLILGKNRSRIYVLSHRSNESRDHYHGDGNLVPSPRCGFGFEAVFQL